MLDFPLPVGTRFTYRHESILIQSYDPSDDTYRLRFDDGHVEDWDRSRVHGVANDA